ncbi:MAG: Rieske 2Fe-2S domain-containing protein [Pseudomonadales bacterium]|nr:Rieske 2Fe-2S domain-containing protein [Pseudomonadales bacterium]
MNIPVKNLPDDKGDNKCQARFARGWHCLGLSRDYGEEPVSLDYFGSKLVAYRGADWQVHILDAYCPHMGADLSEGEVVEGQLVCPFHHWEWGTDGKCSHIPYAKNIPAKAEIKSWPTLEKNGLLYIWHDPEGNQPIAEQEIPEQAEYYDDEWSDWYMEKIRIHNNNRELIDNMADVGHFGPVHDAQALTFKNIVHKHTFTQVMEGDPEIMENADSMLSRATYFGPAVMTTEMQIQLTGGFLLESRLLVSHVPVSENCFDLRFGLLFKRLDGVSRDLTDYIMMKHAKSTTQGFMDDVHIWHNKIRIDHPILCDGDGPIHILRKWHQQFYVDVADVPTSWDEEKEYVVNIHKQVKPQS